MTGMRTWVRRVAPMVAVPALVLALAGCSDDGDGGGEGEGGEAGQSASDSPSAGDTESTPPSITPADVPTPPVVRQREGAVADVEWDQASCPLEAGEQSTSGTLTNPTDERTGYLVQVAWTTAGGDVLGLGFDVVRGAVPDEETEWEVTADVPDGVTQCVITVERGVIPRR